MKKSRILYDRPSDLEPFIPSQRQDLDFLGTELIRISERISGGLSGETIKSIATYVRSMNGYYSNLIEGQNTLPDDIDKALAKKYSPKDDNYRRQLLHHVHFETQKEMEEKLKDSSVDISSPEFIKWIHRSFHEKLPENFREILDMNGRVVGIMMPGEFRKGEVKVNHHEPPGASSLDKFMQRFKEIYLGEAEKANAHSIAIGAAAHHRLTWIHPFDDGNGRVARLFSIAWNIRTRTHSGGLWSMSRGLARKRNDYYTFLGEADADRQGDLDGRGSRSQNGLDEFVKFYLSTALDQLEFMENLLSLDDLLPRLHEYCLMRGAVKKLPKDSYKVLERVIFKGTIKRGELPEILNCSARKATQVAKDLLDFGVLKSDSIKGILKFDIPQDTAKWLFPNLI